jgi:hypothetical protein
VECGELGRDRKELRNGEIAATVDQPKVNEASGPLVGSEWSKQRAALQQNAVAEVPVHCGTVVVTRALRHV